MSVSEQPQTPNRSAQDDGDVPEQTLPKRRRLSGKQPLPLSMSAETSVSSTGDASSVAESPTQSSEFALDESGCMTGLDRSRVALRYWRWWRKRTSFCQADPARRQRLHRDWCLKGLEAGARTERLKQFAADNTDMEPAIKQWAEHLTNKEKNEYVRRSDSYFLTWNGEWGLLSPLDLAGSEPCAGPDAAASADSGACSEPCARSPEPPVHGQLAGSLPLAVGDALDPEAGLRRVVDMCQQLRALPAVARLESALDAVVQACREVYPVNMGAWALEICARTLAETGEVRLHAHAYFHLTKRVRIRVSEDMHMLGSQPYVATRMGVDACTRARNSAAGLWYLQGPKVSTVYVKGTHQPFDDYPVNPLWIFRALQGEKTLFVPAREAMMRIPAGLPRNLEALDRWQRERCQRLVMAAVEERSRAVRASARPFRRFPVVELWKAQYEQTLDRYRFLVLEGPSRMGKTAFVYSLVESACCYEMNLSGGANPDLREYDANVHRLLFFDECTPQQTVANKKLFQAGVRLVSLNTSATNMYAIKVYVGGKMMVCASNDWSAQLRRMPKEDADWVVANSYVLHVTAPMWEEQPLHMLPAS